MKNVGFVVAGMAVVAVTGTLVLASDRGHEAPTSHQLTTDFRWAGAMDPGESLEIKGVNGDITVGPASGREVVITAEARGRKNDPETVRVEVVESANGLTFCAVYPSPEGRSENYCAAGSDGEMTVRDNDVQVDFYVQLPSDVSFVGRTVNGDVEARNVESDVFAVTVNGDVEISTTGFAEAETVNGDIDAAMGARELTEGVSFSTVNGSITLDLADDVDATIDASWLNGDFESDLPFAVQGRLSRRSAQGTLGDGGPELDLETVNGSIRIH